MCLDKINDKREALTKLQLRNIKEGENKEKRCEKGESKTCRMRGDNQKRVEKKIKKISEQTLFGFVGDEFAEVSSGKRLLLSPFIYLPLLRSIIRAISVE